MAGVLRLINGTARQQHAAMLEAEARRVASAAGTPTVGIDTPSASDVTVFSLIRGENIVGSMMSRLSLGHGRVDLKRQERRRGEVGGGDRSGGLPTAIACSVCSFIPALRNGIRLS